ncbi:MAG: hypothetical protein ABIF17_04565 [Patescibacteria group bacterium]
MDIIGIVLMRISEATTNLGSSGPLEVSWFFFKNGGWLVVLTILWPYFLEIWLNSRQDKYARTVKWSYLAIDVPKDNEQSPKAVEQIFNQIWGYKSGANFVEKWWDGVFLQSISLELVSIGGYIQYIIRTPSIFKDLVESAVYAQYPEADITEIEDYTKDITPDNFREKGYKMWGTQFELTNKEFYPIRTYVFFEHSIAQKIIDPLSAMLEMMSKLGRDEQLWFQIVIKAEDDKWRNKAMDLVKDLTGQEVKKKKGGLDVFLEKIYQTFGFMFPGFKPEELKKSDFPSKVLYMSKGELENVNAIEIKASKTAFRTKMRMIYFGKKDSFSKPRGVSPFVGALKQYAAANLNGFKPAKLMTTKVDYWRVEQRTYKKQRKILNQYKSRSLYAGVNPDGYILNVEELASLYHFPSLEVKTSSIKTAQSKKAPAPMNVELDWEDKIIEEKVEHQSVKHESIKESPPSNLPI